MKITIIGCGWLGLPLAESLFKKGHVIYGSTTDSAKLKILTSKGIDSFLYNGDEMNQIPEKCKKSDILIINFPPSKSNDYRMQLNELLTSFAQNTRVIFTSSTGVYLDAEGLKDENSTVNESHVVRLAEKEVLNSRKRICILRLAGLIGPNRHPVKHLSGKIVQNGNHAVNLIHLRDVINAITTLLNLNVDSQILNICSPEHPSKAEYYTFCAEKEGISAPKFELSNGKGKIIDGSLIEKLTNFKYQQTIF